MTDFTMMNCPLQWNWKRKLKLSNPPLPLSLGRCYDDVYFVSISAMPEGPTIPAMQPRKGKKTDPLAAIIIGCMFAIFVFILVISLVCFIKDSRRRRRAREEEGRLLDGFIATDMVWDFLSS